jgi:hypothetical protein
MLLLLVNYSGNEPIIPDTYYWLSEFLTNDIYTKSISKNIFNDSIIKKVYLFNKRMVSI